MKKNLLMSLCLLWSTHLFAGSTTSVRLHPDNDLVVTGTTTSTFTLGSTEPSGDATSESAPAYVYVPMQTGAGEANYFIETAVTTLFTTTANTYTVNFPLYINTTASDYYLHAVVKGPNDSSYKIVGSYSSPLNNQTNVTLTYSVSLVAICTQVTNCISNMANVNTELADSKIYFYLSTDLPSTLPAGTVVSSLPAGGIYFNLSMSTRVYTSSQVTPVISSIRAGDKRAIITYSSSGGITKPKNVRVYNHGSTAAGSSNSPIRSYTGTLLAEEFPYTTNSTITVTDLVNSQQYYLSVLFVDLYKFATVLSVDALAEPLEIQELLKKNSCFLLTAGFGEDHFIIDYFRHFRDTVLSKTVVGRAFISVYYDQAPKYALMIYQHEWIRAAIRGAAYILYFIFNYFFLVVAFGAVISTTYLYKNKEKIKI